MGGRRWLRRRGGQAARLFGGRLRRRRYLQVCRIEQLEPRAGHVIIAFRFAGGRITRTAGRFLLGGSWLLRSGPCHSVGGDPNCSPALRTSAQSAGQTSISLDSSPALALERDHGHSSRNRLTDEHPTYVERRCYRAPQPASFRAYQQLRVFSMPSLRARTSTGYHRPRPGVNDRLKHLAARSPWRDARWTSWRAKTGPTREACSGSSVLAAFHSCRGYTYLNHATT